MVLQGVAIWSVAQGLQTIHQLHYTLYGGTNRSPIVMSATPTPEVEPLPQLLSEAFLQDPKFVLAVVVGSAVVFLYYVCKWLRSWPIHKLWLIRESFDSRKIQKRFLGCRSHASCTKRTSAGQLRFRQNSDIFKGKLRWICTEFMHA